MVFLNPCFCFFLQEPVTDVFVKIGREKRRIAEFQHRRGRFGTTVPPRRHQRRRNPDFEVPGQNLQCYFKICANNDDAAELTQETFVKVIENIAKFQAKSSFYTWVFRIAVNLTLNYCKRSVKLGLKSLDAAPDNRADANARAMLKDFIADESCPDPAGIAENKELHELVIKALMKLEDNQRAVVILRDIEAMNYAQIAQVLDIELGTVKSRLSRARDNLREIFEAISQ